MFNARFWGQYCYGEDRIQRSEPNEAFHIAARHYLSACTSYLSDSRLSFHVLTKSIGAMFVTNMKMNVMQIISEY